MPCRVCGFTRTFKTTNSCTFPSGFGIMTNGVYLQNYAVFLQTAHLSFNFFPQSKRNLPLSHKQRFSLLFPTSDNIPHQEYSPLLVLRYQDSYSGFPRSLLPGYMTETLYSVILPDYLFSWTSCTHTQTYMHWIVVVELQQIR